MGHPFFVQGKGWVSAKDLVVGDKLELLDGGQAYVDAIDQEKLTESVKVYNFEVEDFHTYFVGKTSILVHNVCSGNHGNAWKNERRKYWREQGKLYQNNANGQLSESGTYNVTSRNVERMLRGCAPRGTDNLPVALHHPKGIVNDFYDYREILTSVHRANYRWLYPWALR